MAADRPLHRASRVRSCLVGRTYVPQPPPIAGLTWSAPSLIGLGHLRSSSSVELALDGQSVLTLSARARSPPTSHKAPFTGGETRVLNLHGDLNPHRLLARPGRARRRPHPDGRRRPTRSCAGACSAAATSTTRTLGPRAASWPRPGRRARERPARHLPVRARRSPRSARRFRAPFAFRSLDTRRLRWRAARARRDRSIFGSSTAIQDARGRLHVVADTPAPGSDVRALRAHRPPPSPGRQDDRPVPHARRARTPQRVRVGAAPDGRGFAVWQDKANVGHAAAPGRGQLPAAGEPERPAGLHRQRTARAC